MCKSVNIYFLALPMLCRGFKWELERTFPTPIPSEKICSFPTSRNTIIAPTVKCQQSIPHKMNVPLCRPCAIIQFFCRKKLMWPNRGWQGNKLTPFMYIVIRAMTIHAEREYVKDGHKYDKGLLFLLNPFASEAVYIRNFFSTTCRTACKHAFRFLRVLPEPVSTRHSWL